MPGGFRIILLVLANASSIIRSCRGTHGHAESWLKLSARISARGSAAPPNGGIAMDPQRRETLASVGRSGELALTCLMTAATDINTKPRDLLAAFGGVPNGSVKDRIFGFQKVFGSDRIGHEVPDGDAPSPGPSACQAGDTEGRATG